jgi:hypothetical protein
LAKLVPGETDVSVRQRLIIGRAITGLDVR